MVWPWPWPNEDEATLRYVIACLLDRSGRATPCPPSTTTELNTSAARNRCSFTQSLLATPAPNGESHHPRADSRWLFYRPP